MTMAKTKTKRKSKRTRSKAKALKVVKEVTKEALAPKVEAPLKEVEAPKVEKPRASYVMGPNGARKLWCQFPYTQEEFDAITTYARRENIALGMFAKKAMLYFIESESNL